MSESQTLVQQMVEAFPGLIPKDDHHALRHLVGAYFYQYWDETEYRSWQESVDDFVRRSPDRARTAADQIDALLAATADELELRHTVEVMGLDHRPPEGHRAWLVAIRDRIRSHS